jgi:hypothetical protein
VRQGVHFQHDVGRLLMRHHRDSATDDVQRALADEIAPCPNHVSRPRNDRPIPVNESKPIAFVDRAVTIRPEHVKLIDRGWIAESEAPARVVNENPNDVLGAGMRSVIDRWYGAETWPARGEQQGAQAGGDCEPIRMGHDLFNRSATAATECHPRLRLLAWLVGSMFAHRAWLPCVVPARRHDRPAGVT